MIQRKLRLSIDAGAATFLTHFFPARGSFRIRVSSAVLAFADTDNEARGRPGKGTGRAEVKGVVLDTTGSVASLDMPPSDGALSIVLTADRPEVIPSEAETSSVTSEFRSPREVFRCERFRTTMALECCAQRQLSLTGFGTAVHPGCAAKKGPDGELRPTCPQGRENLVQLGIGQTGGFTPKAYTWFRADYKDQKRAMWRAKGKRAR